MSPSGRTQVVGVIGDPVVHSLSPVLHNAAFAAAGLDWVYVAFPVPRGGGSSAVAAARALGVRGLSVTMPHKADVAGAVDTLTPTAARLGAVNTVLVGPEGSTGDSTDGTGLLAALGAGGWSAAGGRVVVLGAGGAARAVALALGEAGAATVTVVARRPEAAASCAALAGPAGAVGPTGAVADADLVVDATSVGMQPGGGLPLSLSPSLLRRGQLVVDLVYAPAVTPLLEVAAQRGALVVNGLGMLVHQAALQWSWWTGRPAPVDAMLAAVK